MDKDSPFSGVRLIVFLAVSFLFLTIWQKFLAPKTQPTEKEIVKSERIAQPELANQESRPKDNAETKVTLNKTLKMIKESPETVLKTNLVDYTWDFSKGAVLSQVVLKKFSDATLSSNPDHALKLLPNIKTLIVTFDHPQLEAFNEAPFQMEQLDGNQVKMRQETDQYIVERTFRPSQENYSSDWSLSITPKKKLQGTENLGNAFVTLNYRIPSQNSGRMNIHEISSFVSRNRQSKNLGGASNPMSCSKAPEKQTLPADHWEGEVDWLAVGDHYFMQAILPSGKLNPDVVIPETETGHDAVVQSSLRYPIFIKPNEKYTIEGQAFFGPKSMAALKILPKLNTTIDLGWFRFLGEPIMIFLHFIHDHVASNYGVAIILLTILVRILMIPLMQKQMKSMKGMQEIGPDIQKLKDKYGEDRQKLNMEMMKLMKRYNVNPLSGCLPLLVQIPIFLSLWRALSSTADLYHAPFMLWVKDLSAQDPYYILPVLMVIFMVLQQRLTPASPTMDPAQKKMMAFMPVLFGFLMINLPSGLCVYMLVSTSFGIGQQLILARNKRIKKKLEPVVI